MGAFDPAGGSAMTTVQDSIYARREHVAFMREQGATMQQIADRHGVGRKHVRAILQARERDLKRIAGWLAGFRLDP